MAMCAHFEEPGHFLFKDHASLSRSSAGQDAPDHHQASEAEDSVPEEAMACHLRLTDLTRSWQEKRAIEKLLLHP